MTVTDEEILSGFRSLHEAIHLTFTKFTADMDRRFEAIDRRFEAIDKRFETIDKRFEAIDVRFEALERKMEHGFQMLRHDMNRGFDRVDGILDKHERRIAALERQVQSIS